MTGSHGMRFNMWQKLIKALKVMHKPSRTPEQIKESKKLLILGEFFVEFVMLCLTIMDFSRHATWIKITLVSYLVIYLIGIVLTMIFDSDIIPSIIFDTAFLGGFLLTFSFGTCEFFGALWMIVIPPLSMYLLNYSISFWCSFLYLLIIIFLSVFSGTREYFINRYSEIFLTRYIIIYFIDFVISALAMLQLHVMRYNQNTKSERLEEAVVAERKKVVAASMETIIAISNAVQAKDLYTGQHSQRVAHFSCLIAQKLGWEPDDVEELRTIALLHDIGKIGVDEAILNKPSRLTDDEYSQMKMHTTIGGKILKDLTLIPNVDIGATSHHERYDGTGYPENLVGEDIPIEARIIGIADTFDAMNFSRVYRKQCDIDYIKNEFEKGRGTQFDSGLVDVFMTICEENDWFKDLQIEQTDE